MMLTRRCFLGAWRWDTMVVVQNVPAMVGDQEVLQDNPHVLGAIRWKGDLPFLFKVISISKALSIQAHPDKVTPLMHGWMASSPPTDWVDPPCISHVR